MCWRDGSGCRPVNVEACDFLLDLVEGPMQGRREIGGVQFSGRAFDDDDLAVDQVADPAVGADFAQTPGDLADDAGALAHRREILLQRQIADGVRGGVSRFRQRGAERS